jgi:hypothetical protein
MSQNSKKRRNRLIFQTVLFGSITAALYAAVFLKAGPIVELFSRGGYYAMLPIATVFVFSFAHGAFSSKLWSLLGIEAAQKQAVQRPTVSRPAPVKRPRPRLRVNA